MPAAMPRGSRAIVIGGAVIAFGLSAPCAAFARSQASRYHEHAHAISAEFTAPGTNGYSLDVKSENGVVTVVASDERPPVATISITGGITPPNTGSVAASTYNFFDQPRDPNVIETDLGSLGDISVVFQPSGKVHISRLDLRDKSKKCIAPRKIVRRLGTFSGTIEFAGENGYTTVDLPSARGSVGTSPFRNCSTVRRGHRKLVPSPRPTKVVGASLSASNNGLGTDTGAMFLAATKDDGAFFYAMMVEQLEENLSVFRSAQAVAGPRRFSFGSSLDFATLTPPYPFSGRASFHSGGGAWLGSLAVAFPGVSIPLAGPDFSAHLRRLHR